MPVWHELTEPWREDGRLRVVGIVQEQHPARARLFAQWRGLDFPLLWDPFNRTGSDVVPSFVLVEDGLVRRVNPSPELFERELLESAFEVQVGGGEASSPEVERTAPGGAEATADAFRRAHEQALEALVSAHGPGGPAWERGASPDEAVATLVRQAEARPEDPALAFRAGVALRMRHDSAARRPGDFQAALDHWARALALEPNRYVWRRRIQQYGPRADKPYDFYRWVETARREIAERGGTPVALEAELTGAELALPRDGFESSGDEGEPDPAARIRRAPDLVEVESAVAWSTADEPVASVHLLFRPRSEGDAHWNDEGGPMRVWIGTGGLPRGWRASERLLVREPSGPAVSRETRRFQLELALPSDFEGGTLPCHALYAACEGASGTCLLLRREFEVEIPPPRR